MLGPWRTLLRTGQIATMKTAAIALAFFFAFSRTSAAEPFMGAYINIPQLFDGKADQPSRERSISENLDQFRASGLRVLMPFVVTTDKKAHYPSRLISQRPYGDWDPLALLIREGRRRGLETYPAVCVMASGGDRPTGILKEHPEWALRDRAGEPVGYISAGHPDARRWIVALLKEIATDYRPDGLLLDYLRFPSDSAQLDPVSQARFDAAHPAEQFPPGSRQHAEELLKYKRECLTELVGQISGELRALDPRPRIALYMWGAHELKGTRDWRAWADRGYIDMLNLTGYSFPKQYGDKYLDVLEGRFRDVAAVLKELGRPVEFTICVGINTSHGKIREAREIQDYLSIGKRCGVQGASLFTWHYLQPYLTEVMRAGYLKDFRTDLPPAPNR